MKTASRLFSLAVAYAYEIKIDNEIVVYVEYINNRNKVIDFTLHYKNTGKKINDPIFIKKVQPLIDLLN